MDDSEEFQDIIFHFFTKEELWQGSNHIKDEKSSEVVVTDS
jgi:hypothetical protein